MKVYLINSETGELIREFNNVIEWTENSAEYLNFGFRAKIYCSENEYFTDKEPKIDSEELDNAD